MIASCKNKVPTTIQLTVIDYLGNKVNGAQIFLDKKKVGSTNSSGTALVKTIFPKKHKLSLEILKIDPHYYYAPYRDNLSALEGQTTIAVKATMYFVPKPSKKDKLTVTTPSTKAPEVEKPPIPIKKENAELEPAKDLAEEPELEITEELANPKPEILQPLNEKRKLVIYALSNGIKLDDVNIKIGLSTYNAPEFECSTKSGKCYLPIGDHLSGPIKIIARKRGYQTLVVNRRLPENNRLRLALKPGNTIDIFAKKEHYSNSTGASDILVKINNKIIGKTDSWGHISHTTNLNDSDVVTVSMESKDLLPYSSETELVLSGNTLIEKTYSDSSPAKPRLAISSLELSIAKRSPITNISKSTSHTLLQLLKKSFKNSGFDVLPDTAKKRLISRTGKSLTKILKDGWGPSLSINDPDFIATVTYISQSEQPFLQVSLININGDTVATHMEKFHINKENTNTTIQKIVDATTSLFPYEGNILSVNGSEIKINWKQDQKIPLKKNRKIDIYGSQLSILGKKVLIKKIGHGFITKVNKQDVIAKAEIMLPRSHMSIGDKVVAAKYAPRNTQGKSIMILDDESGQPISRVNLYYGSQWLSASGADGKLTLPVNAPENKSIFLVRSGYVTKTIKHPSSPSSGEINLKRSKSFLRLETRPSGATIKVDNKKIGKSPLQAAILIDNKYTKITISNLPGYKSKSIIVDLDEGTIDLTGERAIILERDLMGSIKTLSKANKLSLAIDKAKKIPLSHSDYLEANYFIAEKYLTVFDEPHKAAEFYNNVTKNNRVAKFQNKTYVAAHLNEAVAIYKSGERLKGNKKLAIAHFRKSLEIIRKVKPFLRFINPEEKDLADATADLIEVKSETKIHQMTDPNTPNDGILRKWTRLYRKLSGARPQDLGIIAILNEAKVYKRSLNISHKETKLKNTIL